MSRLVGVLALASLACSSSKSDNPQGDTQTPKGTILAPAADVTIASGQSVTFSGSCTDPDGDAVTAQWSFGGAAQPSQQVSPGAVTFAQAGSFVVKLLCTDSNGIADPAPPTRTVTVQNGTAGSMQLAGKITFDKVPSTDHGLDYAHVAQQPVRGAEVQLVDAATRQTVYASTLTGDDGSYSLSWNGSVGQLQLIVWATTDATKIVVQDNTSNNVRWAMASSAFDPSTTSTLNLNAASGWTGTSYGNPRSAAPFAVLDAAYQAAHSFLVVRPQASFPELHVNWSPNNAPVDAQNGETPAQAYAAGHISTSHWNGSELYILGQENVDTDEFDDHVIVHEWGHYFESKLGRSDSPGGTHAAGDRKDPRLAFGEGWGNALSAMIWAPRSEYTDTSGAQQGSGFGFDLENNTASDPNPGWFSEASVQSVLYDLFDDSGTTESFDTVALGLGPIYDVMTGAEKNTPALTTLFSFVAALKAAIPDQSAAIDALTSNHGVLGAPVADAYGTGETNYGDTPDNLPVYTALTLGGASQTVTFHAGAANSVEENRFLRFTGDGASHTITVSSTANVDAALYSHGTLGDSGSIAAGSSATLSAAPAAGDDVILVLTSGTTSTAQATVSVQ